MLGCSCGSAALVGKNAESVQKTLNQGLYSIRFAAAEHFVTDLATQKRLSGQSSHNADSLLLLEGSKGHLWDTSRSPPFRQNSAL